MQYKFISFLALAFTMGNSYATEIQDIKTLDDSFFNGNTVQRNVVFKKNGMTIVPTSCVEFYQKYKHSWLLENNTPSSSYAAVKSAIGECIVNNEINIGSINKKETGVDNSIKKDLPRFLPADLLLSISNDDERKKVISINKKQSLLDADPSLEFLSEEGGVYVYKNKLGVYYYIQPLGSVYKNGKKTYLFKLTNVLSEGSFNNTTFYFMTKDKNQFKTVEVIAP